MKWKSIAISKKSKQINIFDTSEEVTRKKDRINLMYDWISLPRVFEDNSYLIYLPFCKTIIFHERKRLEPSSHAIWAAFTSCAHYSHITASWNHFFEIKRVIVLGLIQLHLYFGRVEQISKSLALSCEITLFISHDFVI